MFGSQVGKNSPPPYQMPPSYEGVISSQQDAQNNLRPIKTDGSSSIEELLLETRARTGKSPDRQSRIEQHKNQIVNYVKISIPAFGGGLQPGISLDSTIFVSHKDDAGDAHEIFNGFSEHANTDDVSKKLEDIVNASTQSALEELECCVRGKSLDEVEFTHILTPKYSNV